MFNLSDFRIGKIFSERDVPLAPLDPRVAEVLKRAAALGEITRGAVFRVIEMSERTGRTILGGLLGEGLLTSKSEKSAVRLGFPTAAAGYFFPNLYPAEKKD